MSWTATDQSRFGPVSMSKSCSSSLMIPSDDCAASVENFSIGFSAVLARQAAAAASAGNVYLNNMVDDEQEVLRDGGGYVSCHRSTTRRVSSSSRRELGLQPAFMSHALLLRLFLSPSFFSINVALQYLTLYNNNIGITYYLTRRLSEFDGNELREVWGFIW